MAKLFPLQSFQVHGELTPEVWEGMRMKPEVRKQLLKIATAFKESLGIPVKVKDIWLTGSTANYNWSKYSDIDLHLLLDFNEIDEDEDMVRELMQAKKSVFNEEHDITVGPFEVELYAQDVKEPHEATGVYSVQKDKWLRRPKRKDPNIDLVAVKRKAATMMKMIEVALAKESCDSACLDRAMARIKKMRKSGLEKGGEFSVENLAFKVLRRNGYLDKLWSEQRKRLDQELSLPKKVANRWWRLRIALSPKTYKRLQLTLPTEDLPFEKIFKSKKRLAIPAPGIRPEFSDASRKLITHHLKNLGQLNDGEKINWEEGVVESDGRKTKLGKRVAKATAKIEKEYPEAWKTAQKALRAERVFERRKEAFNQFVEGPLSSLTESWRDNADGMNVHLADIYQTLKEFSGEKKPPQKSLEKVVLNFSPARVPTLDPDAQEVWSRGLQAILLAPSDISEQLQKSRDGLKEERGKVKQQAEELATRIREGNSENRSEDRQKLRKLNQASDRLLGQMRRLKFIQGIYEDWPLKQREEFAASVQRATSQLSKAKAAEEEAQEEAREARKDISNKEFKTFASAFTLEEERQKYDHWKSQGTDMSIVISRAPIDVLRMSDHPTAAQKIESCHSETGSYFSCAEDEAHGAGLVAYVVRNSDLEKIDLQADEIFEDMDRSIQGLKPYARLRLRRFEHDETGEELALPEHSVYGVPYDNLLDLVTDWARKEQQDTFEKKPRMREYTLTGGSYRDTEDAELFNHFFDTPDREIGDANHRSKPSSRRPTDSRDEEGNLRMEWGTEWWEDAPSGPETERSRNPDQRFWEWMATTHPQVPNPNPDGRQQRITPTTLREYGESGAYQQQAQQLIQRYLHTYQQQSQRQGAQLLRRAKYNSEFLKWVEQQRFPSPKTKERIKFVSLPEEEQQRIYERWSRMTTGEDAPRVREANRWLSPSPDPTRYDHIKFQIRLEDSTADEDRKRLEQLLGTSDQKRMRDTLLDVSGVGGVASLVESVDVLSWVDDHDVKIKIMGRGKNGLHFDRALTYEETGDDEHPYTPYKIENVLFSMGKGGPPGAGTRMLASQVGAAEQHGFSVIETEASRGTTLNGYYTWPRLGFNAEFTQKDLDALEDADPEAASQVRQLAEADADRVWPELPAELFHVMAVPAAREWWEKKGHSVMAIFPLAGDYSDGGKAYQLLRAYTEAKAMAEGKTIPEYLAKIAGKKPQNKAPQLTSQDNQILDRVWEQTRKRLLDQEKSKKKAAELAQFWIWTKIVKNRLGV